MQVLVSLINQGSFQHIVEKVCHRHHHHSDHHHHHHPDHRPHHPRQNGSPQILAHCSGALLTALQYGGAPTLANIVQQKVIS